MAQVKRADTSTWPAPVTVPAGRFAIFDALQVRDFRLLWTGMVISNIGS